MFSARKKVVRASAVIVALMMTSLSISPMSSSAADLPDSEQSAAAETTATDSSDAQATPEESTDDSVALGSEVSSDKLAEKPESDNSSKLATNAEQQATPSEASEDLTDDELDAMAPPLAASGDTSQDTDVIMLVSTGELYRITATDDTQSPNYVGSMYRAHPNKAVHPSAPYLPALKNAIAVKERRPADANQPMVDGISYNALASAEDGTMYAMLKIRGARGQEVGPFQVYRLTPGDKKWRTFGRSFTLSASRSLTPTISENDPSTGIIAGAVNPKDNRYYYASLSANGFYIYRTEDNGSQTYIGHIGEGKKFNGDIVFTKNGDLVIGSYDSYEHSTSGSGLMSQNLQLSIVKNTGQFDPGNLTTTPVDMKVFKLPTVNYRNGKNHFGVMDYSSFQTDLFHAFERVSGLAIGNNGKVLTGHTAIEVVGDPEGQQASAHAEPCASGGGGQGACGELLVMETSKNLTQTHRTGIAVGGWWLEPESEWAGNLAYNNYFLNYRISKPGVDPIVIKQDHMAPMMWNNALTDMAGGAPYAPSLRLKKNVIKRLHARDQFKLSIEYSGKNSGKDVAKSVTTAGTEIGLQDEVVGPALTAQGDKLLVKEELKGQGTMAAYTPSLKCENALGNDVPTSTVTVSGKFASANIDLAGSSYSSYQALDIDCTFTNGPLVYTATINKVDEKGQPLAGATLELYKDTNDNGALDDPGKIDKKVTVDEAKGGKANPFTTTGADFQWKGLEPGTYFIQETSAPYSYFPLYGPKTVVIKDKDVAVTIENTPARGSASWQKVDEQHKNIGGAVFTLIGKDDQDHTIYEQSSITDNGLVDTDTRGGFFTVENLPVGHYTLSEKTAPKKYVKTDVNFTFDVAINGIDVVTSPIKHCDVSEGNKIVNKLLRGELKIEKVDSINHKRLSGSEWSLKGIDGTHYDEVSIVDCVSAPCEDKDTNATPGIIEVSDLPLGKYQLVETKAPSGYQIDQKIRTFEITIDARNKNYAGNDAIGNTMREGPTLPRSGGVGRDFFFIAGGGVLLLALAALALFGRKQKL